MTRIYHLVDGCFMCRVHMKGKVILYLSMDLESLSLTGNCYDPSFLPWLSGEVSSFCYRAERVKNSLKDYKVFTGKTWKEINAFLDPKFNFDSEEMPI